MDGSSIVDTTSLKDEAFTNRSFENSLRIHPDKTDDEAPEDQRRKELSGPPKIGPVGRSSLLNCLATFIPEMEEANSVMVPLKPEDSAPFGIQLVPQSTESSSESDEDSDASTDDEATGVMDIAIFKDVDGYAAEVEDTISTKLPWAFQDFDDKEEPTSEESRKEEST